MIPGVIARFLDAASVAAASTRDRQLAPHLYMVSGWRAAPDQSEMRLLFGRSMLDQLKFDLQDNGRLAVTVERIEAHETYQFKGRVLDFVPLKPEDRDLHLACRSRFVKAVRLEFDIAEEILARHIPEPAAALRLDVAEIFIQTPGPQAGVRLVPREGA